MIVLALATGAAIGVVLGALGGGAVLTVPAMVYLLGLPVPHATTASVFVVGAWTGRAVAARHSPRALRRAFALLLVGVAAATAAAALG